MEVPGLADEARNLGAAAQRRRQPGIVRRAAPGAPRHAEGGEARVLERRRRLEEGVVGGVGARPAALDVIDAEPAELAPGRRLVGGVGTEPLRLRPLLASGFLRKKSLTSHPRVLATGT